MARESFGWDIDSSTAQGFSDTTEQTVYSDQCYLTGVFIVNPGLNATDGWIQLFDASAPTPGTTAPDIILYCPFSAIPGKGSYRFSFPRIRFATAMTIFFSDTSGVSASAWNGTAQTTVPFRIDVYYERVDS